MKRNLIFSIAIIFLIGTIFIGYEWYGNYKMNKQLEQMNLDKIQTFQAKCECWNSHAENALSAYQQGNDSLIREIIHTTPCEEVLHREEGFSLRHSSWSIYFDYLKSCEYKNTDIIEKSLHKVLKPEIDAKCDKCLSVITDMDYITSQSADKWQSSKFLYYCYPFYGMDIQRSNYIELNNDIAFLRAYDLIFSLKFDSIV